MARLTTEQIEHLKAQGAFKRAERQQKAIISSLIKPLEDMDSYLWNVLRGRQELSSSKVEELKRCFLQGQSQEILEQAYLSNLVTYDDIIYCCWKIGGELKKAAFDFWDKVLAGDKVHPTGNSAIRLLDTPDEMFLAILKKYPHKVFEDPAFGVVAQNMVIKQLNRASEERPILEEIKKLFV